MREGSTAQLFDRRQLRVYGESNRILSSIDEGEGIELVPEFSDCEIVLSGLSRLQSNRLFMVYGVKRSLTDCRYFGQYLDEEGHLDGAVVPIMLDDGYRLVDKDRLVQLQDGRLLLPCILFDGSSGRLNPCGLILIYYSDDEGESWDLAPRMIMGPLLSELGLRSPVLAEQNDGRIKLRANSDNDMPYHCYSLDKGITWSRIIETKEAL